MTEADRIARFAKVPDDLAALVVMAAHRLCVSVKEFRGPNQTPTYVTERRRVTVEARARRYSYCQIGRALNRDHSTIIHAERRAMEEGA